MGKGKSDKNDNQNEPIRDLVFLSKGTPDDDDFALWLAPRLEAAGYKVFADILCLKYGDRWRKILTDTLYDKSCKMLLCCRTSTLAKTGVLEEIEIADKLKRDLQDPRFMVPLRLERNFRAPFGTAGLQFVDFEKSWADGLEALLKFLDEEKVPRSNCAVEVDPEWENYKKRHSIEIQQAPEALISNWLRVSELPDKIRYFTPTGAINIGAFSSACNNADYPLHYHNRGVFTFLNMEEISEIFSGVSPLELKTEIDTIDFHESGCNKIGLAGKDAHNILVSIFRDSWNRFCRDKKFIEYIYSNQVGFHAGEEQLPIGKKVPWGRQGENRSAMLRNIAKGKVWSFGITALPSMWPFAHFKLKSRVLFSEVSSDKMAGPVIDRTSQQHRLRRSVCKGWRNKQWHGRLMAYLETLSGDSAFIKLPLSPNENIKLVAAPMTFTSPVTAELPDKLTDDDEETDDSLLVSPVAAIDDLEEAV